MWKIHFFPGLRLITNTAGLDLNSIYFKSNLHATFSKFSGCAQGLVVVRYTGVTLNQFVSVLFAVS